MWRSLQSPSEPQRLPSFHQQTLNMTHITIIEMVYNEQYVIYYSMISINPYINFNGNAEEAFIFYRSIIGGEFGPIVRFKDIGSDDFPVSKEDAHKILRITLQIGHSLLIANDVPDSLGPVSENENRSKIAIIVDSKEEAMRIAEGLSEGGTVEMPLGESPWGGYFSMFRDRYGIEWTIESPMKA